MSEKKFEPIKDIPFYYSCDFPLYYHKLVKRGCQTTLSLLANCRFFSVPAYMESHREGVPSSMMWWANNLRYDKIIYQTKRTAFPSEQEGLDYIRNALDKDDFIVVCCSAYYLPYHFNYLDKEFVGGIKNSDGTFLSDHWLGIYDYQDQDLLVYDPVPIDYVGKLSCDDFSLSWKGSGAIEEVKAFTQSSGLADKEPYSIMDITPLESLDEDGLRHHLKMVAKTVSYEFLKGRVIKDKRNTYHYGVSGRDKLMLDMTQAMAATKPALKVFKEPLFNLKWSYMYLLDLLKDCSTWCSSDFDVFIARCEEINARWEKFAKQFVVKAIVAKKLSDEKKAGFISDMAAIVECEKQIFSDLIDALDDVPYMSRSVADAEDAAVS